MAPARHILHPSSSLLLCTAWSCLRGLVSHEIWATERGTRGLTGGKRNSRNKLCHRKNHRRHKSAFTQAWCRCSRWEISKISIPITLLQLRHVEVCQINNSITYLAPLLLSSLVEGSGARCLANISLDPGAGRPQVTCTCGCRMEPKHCAYISIVSASKSGVL